MNAGDVTSPRFAGGVTTMQEAIDRLKIAAQSAINRIETLTAERDALQAKLDSMTVEWALRDEATRYTYGPYHEKPWHGDYYTQLERLVSPWKPVGG